MNIAAASSVWKCVSNEVISTWWGGGWGGVVVLVEYG